MEQTIHERNKALRDHYLEVEALASEPGADIAKITRRLKRIGGDFIVLNSRFAAHLVSKAASPKDDTGELYAVALETMWEHFLKWDPEQARFTTYAYYSMLGDVGRARVKARDEGSYGDHQARSAVLASASRLRASLGRAPTIEEIVAETSLTPDTVRRVLRPISTSIDRKVEHDGGTTTLGELIADTRPKPADNLEDLWLSRLTDAFNQLTMQEALIIMRRRGLDGWPPETLQQVGKWLGIGREPVRRAEASALAKLERSGTSLPSAD
jgi:RNA polymerase sigma factor (sigma-70 family)